MWPGPLYAIGEAMVTAKLAGLDPLVWWNVMKGGAADSFVLTHDVPSIFAGHYDPSFSLALCCKDLGLINEIARSQGYELTMGKFVESLFQQAAQTYGESAAELHVVKLLEDRVGMLLRPPHGEPITSST